MKVDRSKFEGFHTVEKKLYKKQQFLFSFPWQGSSLDEFF